MLAALTMVINVDSSGHNSSSPKSSNLETVEFKEEQMEFIVNNKVWFRLISMEKRRWRCTENITISQTKPSFKSECPFSECRFVPDWIYIAMNGWPEWNFILFPLCDTPGVLMVSDGKSSGKCMGWAQQLAVFGIKGGLAVTEVVAILIAQRHLLVLAPDGMPSGVIGTAGAGMGWTAIKTLEEAQPRLVQHHFDKRPASPLWKTHISARIELAPSLNRASHPGKQRRSETTRKKGKYNSWNLNHNGLKIWRALPQMECRKDNLLTSLWFVQQDVFLFDFRKLC